MTQRWFVSAAAAAGLALVLAAVPATPDLGTAGFQDTAALAKSGNGNGGNGNGNGGGNGHGGGKGGHGKDGHQATGTAGKSPHKAAAKAARTRDKAVAKTDRANDRATARAGRSEDSDAVSGFGRGKDKSAKKSGLTASSLGRLNAAHASPTARANAAPHSAVGLIGQYAEAIAAGDLEAAAAALAAAANKDVDLDVVGVLNDLLGLEVDPQSEQEIADQASEAQAAETGNGLGSGKPDSMGNAAGVDENRTD